MAKFSPAKVKAAFNRAVDAHEASGKQLSMAPPRLAYIRKRHTADGELWALKYEDRDYVPVIDEMGVESIAHAYSMRVFMLTGDVRVIYLPTFLQPLGVRGLRGVTAARLSPYASLAIQIFLPIFLSTIKDKKKRKAVDDVSGQIHGAHVAGFGTKLCEEATEK